MSTEKAAQSQFTDYNENFSAFLTKRMKHSSVQGDNIIINQNNMMLQTFYVDN